MPKRLPKLDIVIVNWNAGSLLTDCLKSIAVASRDDFTISSVIIVDNASTDGSSETAAAAITAGPSPFPVTVIGNSENRGFGRACNQGARASRGDYLLFLNPDATVFADSLQAPIAFMEAEENQSVAICGIQLVDQTGAVARSCARAPTPASMAASALALDRFAPERFPSFVMRDWDHAQDRDVDHVIGAFYLIRRHVFAAVDGFDERFFVYLEDLDLSLRVKAAGWRCHYLASTRAFHKGGGVSEKARASRLAYSLESRLRFCFKHFSAPQAAGLVAVTFGLEPGLRLALAARERSSERAKETIGGYARLLGSLMRRSRPRVESRGAED